MTDLDEATTTDTSGAGSVTNNYNAPGGTVGLQAEQVHNSSLYFYSGDDPDKKYANGVRCLENGWRDQARQLFEDVVSAGFGTSEVRFHWLLALLSNRSSRELTGQQHDEIDNVARIAATYPEDKWQWALQVTCRLVSAQRDVTADPDAELNALESLPSEQYNQIVHHLRHIITGGLQEQVWGKLRDDAQEHRFNNNRHGRMWTYFEPEPARPRARRPIANTATRADQWVATATSTLVLVALGYLGWLVMTHPDMASIIAYPVALTAGIAAARHGLEWRYRVERFASKELTYYLPRRDPPGNPDGFAGRVYSSFEYYFGRYRPENTDREKWLEQTAGIRETLYREIADIYRESRTQAGNVKWLIRHLARTIARAGVSGELQQLRQRYRVAPATKIWCTTALAVFVPATLVVLTSTIQHNPLNAIAASLVLLISTQASLSRWWHLVSERRRLVEDEYDYEQNMRGRQAEYDRWAQKLHELCPREHEMEYWLDCDKTVFLDETLRHYGLTWRDIIAHTFLLTRHPSQCRKRARSADGPWRYSDYEMRLFLITPDGVREVVTHHVFDHGSYRGRERDHFRFDAVSSIYVAVSDKDTHRLELTLMNGAPKKITIVDEEANEPGFGAEMTPEQLSAMNLEMTGFAHTLHILESIAADGKEWIARDRLARESSDKPAAWSATQHLQHVRELLRTHRNETHRPWLRNSAGSHTRDALELIVTGVLEALGEHGLGSISDRGAWVEPINDPELGKLIDVTLLPELERIEARHRLCGAEQHHHGLRLIAELLGWMVNHKDSLVNEGNSTDFGYPSSTQITSYVVELGEFARWLEPPTNSHGDEPPKSSRWYRELSPCPECPSGPPGTQ